MKVEEVIKINKERDKRHRQLVSDLLDKIYAKVLHYAKNHKLECLYTVPSVIAGMPLFNISEITMDIYNKLDKDGYIVTAYNDGRIHICWNENDVKKKAEGEAYMIDQEKNRIKNVSKKKKNIDQKYDFLANPEKKSSSKSKSKNDEWEKKVNKIIKEGEKRKKQLSSLLKK
jgi:hypothetical protein